MRRIAGGILMAAALQVSGVQAQPAEDFYAGKQINLIVGYNPGGGYDIYSRLAAEFLPNYIPGNPAIVVQNMPGAGGLLAANYLYLQAPQDGLTIGMISQSAALSQVVREEGLEYDVREFNWLGRLTTAVEVTAVWHTSSVKTIEDAMETEIILSATAPGGTSHMMPSVMNHIVGTKFNIVAGYPGVTGAQYAMEQGEVEGSHSTVINLLTAKEEWLRDETVSILVQYAMDRHPALPDVPAMTEFGTTEEDQQILALFGSTADLGRALAAPPGVPEDRIEILRDAFTAMIEDPVFQETLAQRNLEFDPMSGAELQERVGNTVDIPEHVSSRVIELLAAAAD